MNERKKIVHMYPTLRCNGKCSYCSNTIPSGNEVYPYQEKLPGHWIKFMRMIEDWEMYFTGGEFFLFQDFADIIENIPRYARIYTNGTFVGGLPLGKADSSRLLFRCSYHPNIAHVDGFLEGLEKLKSKKIPFQIHVVDVLKNDAPSLKVDVFRKRGYEIAIDYDQGKHVHKKGKVKCFIPSVFVAPDGTVFGCVSKMLRNKDGKGNCFENYVLEEAGPVVCDESEMCAACDLAAASQEIL